MIARPKHTSFYPERAHDCVHAVEARFSELLLSLTGAFIDREAISATLIPEASRAGWAQHEITDAIDVLVARRPMATAHSQRDSLQTGNRMPVTTFES